MAQQQQQAGVAGPGAQPNLEALRDNAQIQHLREQIGQNPALLQFLIQQVASQNPAMAQMLAENPQALLQLLGNDDGDGDGDDAQVPIPPGAQVVSVTEEERAAIQRVNIFHHSWASLCPKYHCSWKHWGFLDRKQQKHILLVTRMKSSQPTFCLTVFTMTVQMNQITICLSFFAV